MENHQFIMTDDGTMYFNNKGGGRMMGIYPTLGQVSVSSLIASSIFMPGNSTINCEGWIRGKFRAQVGLADNVTAIPEGMFVPLYLPICLKTKSERSSLPFCSFG